MTIVAVAPTSASSFSGGQMALSGGIGLAVGVLGTALLMRGRRCKKTAAVS